MAVKTAARTATRDEAAPRMERDNVIRNRLGEPVELARLADNADDKFNLERMGIYAPEGWAYEWKTKTVKNWEWTDHQVELAQTGWTPVPADRHDGKCMPRGYTGVIERSGLVLMERDERLVAMARQNEKRQANGQLNYSRSMAGLMPSSGITDFNHGAAKQMTGVKVERQARMPDTNYNYTVDE